MKRLTITEDTVWMALATAIAVIAGVVMRNTVKGGYRLSHHGQDPPQHLAEPDRSWTQAVMFMALTGAAVGIARLLGREGAARVWRRYKGNYPRRLLQHH